MGKEEFQTMKSCFEELYMFISMRSDISSSKVRTEEAEFKQPRPEHYGKRNYIFNENLC